MEEDFEFVVDLKTEGYGGATQWVITKQQFVLKDGRFEKRGTVEVRLDLPQGSNRS